MTTPFYADEWVSLYNGDCLELADLWTCADVLVTDPPDGIGWTRNGISRVSRGDRKAGRYSRHARSSESDAGIRNDATTEARDRAIELWGEKPAFVFGSLIMPPPRGTKQTAIFVKALDSGNLTAIGGIRRNVEAIYLLGKHRSGGGGRSAVFATSAPAAGSPSGYVARSGGHPHTKPQDVMQEIIMLTEGIIADPFAGSGSTLVAAKALGRRAIGVELEERYAEIAAKRLLQDALDFGEPA